LGQERFEADREVAQVIGGAAALTLASPGIAPAAVAGAPGSDYPPLQPGMRGFEDAMEAGHAVRDGKSFGVAEDTGEAYDLIVVGAGMSGLSAAYFYRKQLPDAKILVLDGCDNVEARLLINDACLKHRVPWIYGAAVGTSGATMPIIPGDGPCFRCMVPAVPPPGSIPTGQANGILSTVPHLVASLQCTEALKLLCGRMGDLVRPLRCVDLWAGTMESIEIAKGPGRCRACDEGRWDFLESRAP
jgi:adenylyltransferase/sulfurtransferase